MQGKYAALSVLCALTCIHASLADDVAQHADGPTPRIVAPIDDSLLVALPGHVLKILTPDLDLGPVEDSKPFRLYLNLRRTSQQQAELDALIARQRQPGTAEYHQRLTPQEYGARFGIAPADIDKISTWLESQGFKVKSVLNNRSVIDFAATAGGVRSAFHTEIHYWNIEGGRYPAVSRDPSIPAALREVVVGIEGLNKLPPREHHTAVSRNRKLRE
jgi:Pro-kumamolisin, activation domain